VLSREERHELLRVAREAIRQRLTGAPPSAPPRLTDPARRAGAFVTLRLGNDLRGCIGHPGGERLLADVVAECAVAAATEDPRFPPLTPAELARVQLEVSVLGPITPVADLAHIEVGRHGLIAEQGFRRGLLLPQVASEQGWGRETFLSHTCLKAGLKADAWKSGARIFCFEAEVFGEEHASEPIA
jgi:AmmeMemoRadiSam system protein A